MFNREQCSGHSIRILGRVSAFNSFNLFPSTIWASLVAHMVKNLLAMQEMWVWPLGWEDPLEEGMATHTSILAWRIPMVKRVWWATVHGVTKSCTRLSDSPTSTIQVHSNWLPWLYLLQLAFPLLLFWRLLGSLDKMTHFPLSVGCPGRSYLS